MSSVVNLGYYASVPYQNSKKTEFSDHGVSIPLRILTSYRLGGLPFYLYYYTIVYIIIFPLLDLYINCVTLLSRLILFFDWLSRIFQTLSTVFFLGVYVSVRACV